MLSIEIKLDNWKKKLLDLGKRNRLINYKETKTANSAAVLQYLANYTLPEAGNKPDAAKEFLFDALYGEDSIEYLDENFKSCAI